MRKAPYPLPAKDKVYAVILAGGFGTRFWPLSRQIQPKQLLKFYNRHSLLQQTIKRIKPLVSLKNIYLVTSNLHKFEFEEQISVFGIPKKNILFEPEGKNTAPAIGLAAINIQKKDPDSILIILPADHHISDKHKFKTVIKKALSVAADNYLVTLGIKPNEPATGYGYIKLNPGFKIRNSNCYKIAKFTEKPSLTKAKKYTRDKHYLWNSGMFIVKSRVIIDEIKEHLPKLHNALSQIIKGKGLIKVYNKLNSISIDYGVLEKSKRVVVIAAGNFGWSDLGTLSSLNKVLPKNKNGNIIRGNSIDIGSRNITVLGEKRLISTIGLKDLIAVDTEDAILICNKNTAEDVKKMVDLIIKKGGREYFSSHTVKRPWGRYTVLNKGKGYKVKIIVLLPRKRLSLQRHRLRSEHWVVVEGTAKVTFRGKQRLLKSNESIFVGPGQIHRLENPGNTPLKIIEVQSGSYLEEDDIERINDDFSR